MFGSRYDSKEYVSSLSSSSNLAAMANSNTNNNNENNNNNRQQNQNSKMSSSSSNGNQKQQQQSVAAAAAAAVVVQKKSRANTFTNGTSQSNTAAAAAAAATASSALSSLSLVNSNVLTFKNKLLCDLTRAIQMVQKLYLDKEKSDSVVVKKSPPLTNSDYQVHELCHQFDSIFLYGLKQPDAGYWKFVLDFTHKNVTNDLNGLLNISTIIGRGRAWLYHALNDSLMESYLKCILDNKKLVLRFYKKDASLIADEQAVSVLVTLVAGLENVEFKLHNDVPYLDHSCWPTHLNVKRLLVDSILNASSDSLSQLIANNQSGNNSSLLNNSNYSISNSISTAAAGGDQPVKAIASSSSSSNKRSSYAAMNHHRKHPTKKQGRVNNISLLDNSSSPAMANETANNLTADLNSDQLNDESSETSGRYTAKTLLSTTPTPDTSPNSNNFKTSSSQKHHNHHSMTNKNNKKSSTSSSTSTFLLAAAANKRKNHRSSKMQEIHFDDDDEGNDESTNDDNEEEEDEEEADTSLESSDLTRSLTSDFSNRFKMSGNNNNNNRNSKQQQQQQEEEEEAAKIDMEISRLREENSIYIENNMISKSASSKSHLRMQHQANLAGGGGGDSSSSSSLLSTAANNNSNAQAADLVASSLKTSSHFDEKIQHLENYSNIIEVATSKMYECVNDIANVYKMDNNYYDRLYSSSSKSPSSSPPTGTAAATTMNKFDLNHSSVYDYEPPASLVAMVTEQTPQPQPQKPQLINENNSNNSSSSNINNNNKSSSSSDDAEKEVKAATADDDYRRVSSDEEKKSSTSKLEIKIDNNTKLMLMIDVLQDAAQHDELIKFFHASKDHSQGEIEAIQLLVTTQGIYVLTKRESSSLLPTSGNGGGGATSAADVEKLYKIDAFIQHAQMDYIEVSLGEQAVHFVCVKKAQSLWITTACRKMTNDLIESIQLARSLSSSSSSSANIKLTVELAVFKQPMQQQLALKKFLASEESSTSIQNIEINNYSLVYWEDQASAVSHLIHKEGMLTYMNKASSTGEWKRGYFILKNDVLTMYKTASDKRPTQVIKLNGEDFSGCRKSTGSVKPYTIELILSNANKLYLSTKSEADASDWLQCFCKIISLGEELKNYHTDVPTNSCLPCCSVLTSSRLYFCHEDLNSGFYRLLESIKLQEINRISFDNDCPYFCILHDDYESKADNKKLRYWFVYFVDANERNVFITSLKDAWEKLFQVPFTIEKCKSSEMRKRCIRSVHLVHKYWSNSDD